MSSPTHGYRPSLSRRAIKVLVKFIISILSLNRASVFSAEFCQALHPYKFIDIPDTSVSLRFLASHGRLLWRASTLLSEEPLILKWFKSMSPNLNYLDVGANVGSYVLLAKAYNPSINITAAELDFNFDVHDIELDSQFF